MDWFLYTLLTEKQKEKLTHLFSEKQKETLKKWTMYGRKRAQRLKIKQYKDYLYTLGFTERVLNEMTEMYKTEKDLSMKRLLAWELTLWFANKYTKKDAKKALSFINDAKIGERDRNQLRRIAIIEAECLEQVGERDEAYRILEEAKIQAKHPDIFLAFANLEQDVKNKLHWVNKAYQFYHLQPITFANEHHPHYDALQMENVTEPFMDKDKVSVILPAYNSEIGIQIAIESILSQTWQNLELLIVDDCSTDNTLEVIHAYANKDDRIKVFQTPVNSGPYVARNIAMQHATGEFITVNDADDWSHEKKIEIQATHLQNNPSIIANTSEHARLTEDLKFYRRGTPGRYIFANMSSIMFRRKIVHHQIGYWDSVRFAADGEFKRRLIKQFGKEKFVDLATGPLSLPRQSVSSLTGSSAFGYNGFFMGVRKEYVESLEFYHKNSSDLYVSYPQSKRPFPVPEPMLPNRENKQNGYRYIDVVIAADFRLVENNNSIIIQEIEKWRNDNKRIGLVQMYKYDVNLGLTVSTIVREYIDGDSIQMLVYGEKINTEQLNILHYNVMGHEQKYIPTITAKHVHVIVESTIEQTINDNIQHYFNVQPVYYPLNANVRNEINKEKQFSSLIATTDWVRE